MKNRHAGKWAKVNEEWGVRGGKKYTPVELSYHRRRLPFCGLNNIYYAFFYEEEDGRLHYTKFMYT